jgi:Delta6-protoilludene synthase
MCRILIWFDEQDIMSYNKEQAVGDVSDNILPILMRLYNLDIEGAMRYACGYHYELQARFIALSGDLPKFGLEVDRQLEEYVANLGRFVSGSVGWSFACKRYFGDLAAEVKRTRLVPLLPPKVT